MSRTTASTGGAEVRPIVVGVDGSDYSKRALKWAAEQSRLTGLALVAVTTWEWPVALGWAGPWPEDLDLEAGAHQTLKASVEETLGADQPPNTALRVVQGHAASVLTKLSDEASLLVVGSRGHGEFAGLLLGSVSEFVAAHARCPVVVVRRREDDR